jgi:hypothetical protein
MGRPGWPPDARAARCVAEAALQLSGQPRARRPVGPFRYTTLGCCTVSSPSVGVESVRRLSAVSRRTSGSTTACWSSWSSLTSANGIVPQSLPSEKRKVAGSIPSLATRNAQVSEHLLGLATAGDRIYPKIRRRSTVRLMT